MTLNLREAVAADADAIAAIYNHYIRDTIVTFEEEAVSAAEMARRLATVRAAGWPYLVAERDGSLLGYAYASAWKARRAYRHSVESTVYLHPQHTGQGCGRALYEALLTRLRALPVHAVIGCISLPNAASIALHERLGFVQVSQFREVGFKFGRWIDVGDWQLRLDDQR